MTYGPTARERAMKVREVLLRAMSGEITWVQAADILGYTTRTVRRWKWRLEHEGPNRLFDRRRRRSPRRISAATVRQVLRLYRRRYRGFNVRHFCSLLRREHGVVLSYTFVRLTLQEAGLVKKLRPRGCHRLRRDPRACFGELLHLDGSPHRWLALSREQRPTLITVVDDATRRLLYARLTPSETTEAVLAALHAVIGVHGVPMALYTDRASWAVHTPERGQPSDLTRLTHVGRALQRLGIQHILAYSPQARGRSERANRTLQGRLVNELRVAGIRTLEGANRYLIERFVPAYNEEFGVSPTDPVSVFVTAAGADLDQILCFEERRVVGKDNVVQWERVALQVPRQPGRKTCAGLPVLVRRHLDQRFSVWCGPRCLARYGPTGRLIPTSTAAPQPALPAAHEAA
jgi:transposase